MAVKAKNTKASDKTSTDKPIKADEKLHDEIISDLPVAA